MKEQEQKLEKWEGKNQQCRFIEKLQTKFKEQRFKRIHFRGHKEADFLKLLLLWRIVWMYSHHLPDTHYPGLSQDGGQKGHAK